MSELPPSEEQFPPQLSPQLPPSEEQLPPQPPTLTRTSVNKATQTVKQPIVGKEEEEEEEVAKEEEDESHEKKTEEEEVVKEEDETEAEKFKQLEEMARDQVIEYAPIPRHSRVVYMPRGLHAIKSHGMPFFHHGNGQVCFSLSLSLSLSLSYRIHLLIGFDSCRL